MNTDRVQTQNEEFNFLQSLTAQWNLLKQTAVVDDDYPSVRHVFESRLADFIDGMKANGRFEKGNRYQLQEAGSNNDDLIEALRTIDRLHNLGDAVYAVRSRAVESGEPFEGNSWEHPNVKAYSEAVQVVKAAIK